MNTIAHAADGASADGSPQARLQLAMEQVAMHAVKLAVARWTTGYLSQEAVPASTQSRWYDEAHGNFTAWLSAGGFAQAETEPLYSETALEAETERALRDDAAAAQPSRRDAAPQPAGLPCTACN